jgi:hypothetical protein
VDLLRVYLKPDADVDDVEEEEVYEAGGGVEMDWVGWVDSEPDVV